jgi:hypothetical protein
MNKWLERLRHEKACVSVAMSQTGTTLAGARPADRESASERQNSLAPSPSVEAREIGERACEPVVLELIVTAIETAEQTALMTGDETQRSDLTSLWMSLWPICAVSVEQLRQHLQNLAAGRRICHWNRPLPGLAVHSVYGISCRSERDCTRETR